MSDARALVEIELDGSAVVLCGSHELMHRRAGRPATSIFELRAMFGDRRGFERRAQGEVDELAANLTDAFITERRVSPRRAS
jgi:hypothetical protein